MAGGIRVAIVFLAALSGYAESQDSATGRTPSEGLGVLHRVLNMAEKKEDQCMRAIGNGQFCRCIATKLPSIDFVQYVEMVAKTDAETEGLAPETKQTITLARKCRDLCVK
jgi:hypothetical protein